jgi:hypothetical protein
VSEKINLTQLRHDAEIEAGLEDGDCIMDDLAYTQAVLALIDVGEAAIATVSAIDQGLIYDWPIDAFRNATDQIDRLRETLERYEL